eukprot:CAMPEP_0171083686 /NCGR_PEP_ID=MMETSP0766_2-20121228/17865_1 /TAXON_ID=439317 /ORGANISM="Gambierdiscus australes, Strain CAWD 149" /LENGTH=342 /DNA_ID=CAMNT_0011541131 /DNA_START=5 /DNA_END=1031 /DNA_ORIENTATION=+
MTARASWQLSFFVFSEYTQVMAIEEVRRLSQDDHSEALDVDIPEVQAQWATTRSSTALHTKNLSVAVEASGQLREVPGALRSRGVTSGSPSEFGDSLAYVGALHRRYDMLAPTFGGRATHGGRSTTYAARPLTYRANAAPVGPVPQYAANPSTASTVTLDPWGRCLIPMWEFNDFVCSEHSKVLDYVDAMGSTHKMINNDGVCTITCPGERNWLVPDAEHMFCKNGQWSGRLGTPVTTISCKTAGWVYFSCALLLIVVAAGVFLSSRKKSAAAAPARRRSGGAQGLQEAPQTYGVYEDPGFAASGDLDQGDVARPSSTATSSLAAGGIPAASSGCICVHLAL